MKIALISTPFVSVPPKDYGGTELIVHELAEGLVELGHEVTVFATGDSVSSARLEFLFHQAEWPPDSLVEVNHVSWAFSKLEGEGYEIIHCHSAMALALGRLATDLPLVYTLHHVRDDRLSNLYKYFPNVWYTAISERQRELEVPLPRISVIHHGLDEGRYSGPTPGGESVCFIGRLSQVKGPHTAIDVAQEAGYPIDVAGRVHDDDADPTFSTRELASRLEEPHVTYHGAIGMERKRELLCNSRALLMPITWEEPFGLVMIEAMLSGCPVLAFPRGSVPELVEDGITGYVVEDAGSMSEVLRNGLDGFDRERCRQRAIERFGREAMVTKYEALYRQVSELDPELVTTESASQV